MLPYLLFCESAFEPNKVDEDFEDQFDAAKRVGFKTTLFHYDDFVSDGNIASATKRIPISETLQQIVYRGWMLTPKQYSVLYENLLSKNYRLINTPQEYQNCHYLPDSLKFISDITPKTVYGKFDSENAMDELIEKTKIFGNSPVILKDYVKSEKHDWETACFVPDASDAEKLRQTMRNLLELRGKYLNEGLVVREFVPLESLTPHSKSGMPLTEEYRLFFLGNKLLDSYDYWEEGDYGLEKPDTMPFEEIASKVGSNFFSMDIARKKNGEFIIIELGDAQVSGLPDKTDRLEFYQKLKHCFE